MRDPVTYEISDGIAELTMDDGKVNALSIEMLKALHAALDRAEADEAVVLLSGRENFFSAGFDLTVFNERPGEIVEMLTLGATLAERLLAFPRPVVVACTGHAIAAGTFIPLSSDVRIGAEGDFKYGLNEVRIGLTLPFFAVELARHRLSPAEFDRALLTGRSYSPSEAVAAGFLDSVEPPESLREAGLEAARDMTTLNAEAHAASKLRVRADVIEATRKAIETELESVG